MKSKRQITNQRGIERVGTLVFYPLAISPIHTYNRVMSRILKLYRLQQLDSQLDQNRSRINAIESLMTEEEELRAAEAAVTAAGSLLKEAQQRVRTADQNVRAQRLKIEQTESALYSGSTNNPKELADLQNEISALKRYLWVLEERELSSMEEEEKNQAAETAARQTFSERGAERSRLLAELADEKNQLLESIERLTDQRETARSNIEAGDMNVYSDLRLRRRGLAVALAEDQSCSACGALLTPARVQEASYPNKLVVCDTCGRLLYAQ